MIVRLLILSALLVVAAPLAPVASADHCPEDPSLLEEFWCRWTDIDHSVARAAAVSLPA